MAFSDKIEEWIKEAEERPESAILILRLAAGRLRELAERNELLLNENIALQNGTRVEEFQKRIAYLEYQVELLKKGLPDGGMSVEAALSANSAALSLLVYNSSGYVLRVEVEPEQLSGLRLLGRISGQVMAGDDLPRLMVLPSHEEVLLLFTSGRISTCALADIPALNTGGEWSWKQAGLPDEPHAGELLACIMPLSRLPLSDYFLQSSRRGCIKKTITTVSQSVLDNRFLGRGAIQKSDQAFDVLLGQKKDQFALVTYEGRLLGLDVDALSYSVEERIKLEATDHAIAAFILRSNELLLCLTQTGKVVYRESGFLELARSPSTRGQALISPSRLDQGTRFIGAAAVRDTDCVVALDISGNLTIHPVAGLTGSGSLQTSGLLLGFTVIPALPAKVALP